MNQINTNKGLPFGRQLLEVDFDLKNPLHYVVSFAEYNELKMEGDIQGNSESYEEYCEHERDCWNQMAIPLMAEPWASPSAGQRPII